ncbi:DUF4190 domain-containing protein [Bacillus sp. 165]|uniref:DUF4190 domain-containing protein n=1 Tax=Bacillus sp. 165 TaxID=1529117 RepID=UPI001ADA17F8|nr:DUF4190 domain-containing protein [Bacillus sp. 165]MBO9128117.1 PASTA domain-containing protein [Bacillus sp. 165]
MSRQENTAQTVIVQKESNGSAVTALVLGIIGVVIGFIPYIGWLMAPVWLLAIIFGAIGMRKKYKRGMSLTGLILGILGAVYKIGFWIVAAGGLLAALSSTGDMTSATNNANTSSHEQQSVSTIPSVKGDNIDLAKSKFEENGIEVDEIVKIEDESIPEGQVIKTDPKEGTEVKAGSKVVIYQSTGGPAKKLILKDIDTEEDVDIIKGRKKQIFVYVYFAYSEPKPDNPHVMDEINKNIDTFKKAGIEVIGIIDQSTSYENKQLIKSRNWQIPVYLDKDEVYFKEHDIFFTPDISVEDGTGNIITDALNGDDFFFETVKAEDVVNEILDKVKINN